MRAPQGCLRFKLRRPRERPTAWIAQTTSYTWPLDTHPRGCPTIHLSKSNLQTSSAAFAANTVPGRFLSVVPVQHAFASRPGRRNHIVASARVNRVAHRQQSPQNRARSYVPALARFTPRTRSTRGFNPTTLRSLEFQKLLHLQQAAKSFRRSSNHHDRFTPKVGQNQFQRGGIMPAPPRNVNPGQTKVPLNFTPHSPPRFIPTEECRHKLPPSILRLRSPILGSRDSSMSAPPIANRKSQVENQQVPSTSTPRKIT